jgi:hypothetical protein
MQQLFAAVGAMRKGRNKFAGLKRHMQLEMRNVLAEILSQGEGLFRVGSQGLLPL